MKKAKKAGFIICIILILFIGGKIIIRYSVDKIKSIPVVMPDLSYIADGKYIGEYSVTPVHVKVEVTIEGCEVINIEIIEHNNGLGSSAESIVNNIVERQSLEVAAISGATVSSKCILKAVENALENAVPRK